MGINTFPAAQTGYTNFSGYINSNVYGTPVDTGSGYGLTGFTVNATVPAGTYLLNGNNGQYNYLYLGSTQVNFSATQSYVYAANTTLNSYVAQVSATWNENVNFRNVATCSGISTIVYGNGRYVLQPYGPANNANGCVSTDGANWATSLVMSAQSSGINLGFANGYFIANPNTANGCIRYSTDGVNWTTQLTWSSLASVSGGWAYADAQTTYFSAASNGAILVSTNLTTWASRATVTSCGSGGRALYVNPWWIVATSSALAISTNGTTWTTRDTGITSINDIAYGNNRYVVVTNSPAGVGAATVAVSTNTINWATVTLPWTSAAPSSITFGNGHFVCIGNGLNNNNGAFSSTDGINWHRRSPAVGGNNSPYIITWGTTGGYIAMVSNSGGSGTTYRSFDVAGRTNNQLSWFAQGARNDIIS